MRTQIRGWRVWWAVWALAVVYYTTLDLMNGPSLRPHWVLTTLLNVLQVGVWGPLLLPAFAVMKRWPLGGLATWRRWAGLFLLSLVLVALGIGAAYLILACFPGNVFPNAKEPTFVAFRHFFGVYFHFYFLELIAALGVYQALLWQQRFKDRELMASQLESRLVQAQNQALRMQLQPHFLFNTLHSISALMHTDVEDADRMLSRLADLLRLSLERSGEQEISLAQELAFLEAYLEIEHIRFRDRLVVGMHVPENLRAAALPTFILQPLVENALKHGFARRAEGGLVAIRAWEDEDRLVLEVEDDGRGAPKDYREGVGVRSVRERLQLLYGGRASFSLEGRPGRGTLAKLALPLRFLAPVEPLLEAEA